MKSILFTRSMFVYYTATILCLFSNFSSCIAQESNTIYRSFVNDQIHGNSERYLEFTKNLPDTMIRWTGLSFTASVEASDLLLEPSYQWQKNGKDITNASTNSYTISKLSIQDSGNYQCIASTFLENITSTVLKLKVMQAATIRSNSNDTTLSIGETLKLYVSAFGDGVIEYRWFKNGVLLANANKSEYLLGPVKKSDAGSYQCVVSNQGGSDSTHKIKVAIKGYISITEQPSDQTVYTGKRLRLTVKAVSNDVLKYQWYKNGITVNDQKKPELDIKSVVMADSGSYRCVISSVDANDSSKLANVKIFQSVFLSKQPVSLTKQVNQSAQFTVEAVGHEPIIYKWYKNKKPIENVTTNTLFFASVTPVDAGVYHCSVANGGGAVLSDSALLIIKGPATITQESESIIVWTKKDTSIFVSASGTEPISYQWQKKGMDIVGATTSRLRFTSITAADAGMYTCIVANVDGKDTSRGTYLATLQTVSIITHPVSVSKPEGDSLVLHVQAGGTDPITYQWQHDFITMPNQTKPQLLLPRISASDKGKYRCIATNGGGSDTSSEALISVLNSALQVLKPNGGELLFMNEYQRIKWTYSPLVKSVKIEFSADGGSLWQRITDSIPNVGEYEWRVCQVLSDFCKVKVSSADNDLGYPSDMSDSLFSIRYITPIKGSDKKSFNQSSVLNVVPNPVSLSNNETVKCQLTLFQPYVEARLLVFDPIGSIVFQKQQSVINQKSTQPFTLSELFVDRTSLMRLTSQSYLVVVVLRDSKGGHQILKKVLGVRE